MLDYQNLWDVARSEEVAGTPLDEAAIARCEAKYGVKFPPSFVAAYRRQNGGVLRDCDSPQYLMPLCEDDTAHFGQCIRPLTSYEERGEVVREDDLEWVEQEHGDPALVFPLWTDGHVVHALNFNKRGPAGEPSVVWIDFECTSSKELAGTFAEWLESLLASEDEPLVHWEEAGCCGELVARETVELEYGAAKETVRQILCREGDQLVLFTHETGTVRGEELSKVTLPADFDPGWATISPFRPEPCQTYTLHLQPRDVTDIHWVTSKRTSEGKWKNHRSQGVPIYCTFESKDREKLEELRAKLLKGRVPKKVLAQEELQQRYEQMSPEQQSAAFAQQLLVQIQQMDQILAELEEDLGPVSDELKLAIRNVSDELKVGIRNAARSAAFAQQLLLGVQQMGQILAEQEHDLGPVSDELKLAMGNVERMMEDLQRREAGQSVDRKLMEDLQRRAAAQPVDPELIKIMADALGDSGEMVEVPPPERPRGKQRSPEKAAPPPSPEPAALSEEDEAALSQYEATCQELANILDSVVDEPSARQACPRLEAKADELRALTKSVGSRFESYQPDPLAMAVHLWLTQCFMRVHGQVYRIQHGVPGAGQHLQGFLQRLLS